MSPFLAELFGTAILIMLGDGVVANVVLARTKGNNSGWIVITAGWACAVTIGVYCVNSISGAHLNPAVTIALAAIGKFPWSQVLPYIVAQILGGFIGGVIVWLAYLPHWAATPDAESKLAVFSTSPAIRAPGPNLIAEIIGGFALVLARPTARRVGQSPVGRTSAPDHEFPVARRRGVRTSAFSILSRQCTARTRQCARHG